MDGPDVRPSGAELYALRLDFAYPRVGGEGQHTIHVLKDITDRREAERRYRELFDNIQEGLFFAVPDGHFIEVNDALRMLGYADREEPRTDIPNCFTIRPNVSSA
jgi:PAS domain-containing protein